MQNSVMEVENLGMVGSMEFIQKIWICNCRSWSVYIHLLPYVWCCAWRAGQCVRKERCRHWRKARASRHPCRPAGICTGLSRSLVWMVKVMHWRGWCPRGVQKTKWRQLQALWAWLLSRAYETHQRICSPVWTHGTVLCTAVLGRKGTRLLLHFVFQVPHKMPPVAHSVLEIWNWKQY